MSIVTCSQRLAAAAPVFIPGTEPFCQAWCAASIAMGITDFDVCSVDWNTPVPWAETSRPGWGAVMPEYAGYLIVILFGVFFSVITSIMVWFEKTFGGLVISSEHFNTAGRNIKTGLTASVIVSQWTWAATLLQSSNVAWRYGLSGPFWYAAGASIQVLLFGILAIEVKKKAPNMHTFLEMIDVRWGKAAHMTFLFFGFATNLIVTGMLLLGGAAVVYQTSSMATEAALFLIPVGVIIYTMFGGLKATFLASYIHTTIIFIGLVLFVTYVYAIAGDCGADLTKQCNSIGSAAILWERLTFVAALPSVSDAVTAGAHHGPVPNNRGGSYLTMLSNDGLSFGVINIIGNFGTVFVDQSYWQSAIAARPASAHKGYILGGLVWFTIPMALATSLGLASNALNVKLSSDEAGSGLAPPAAAIVLLGQGGGILIIIMLFMAITSTGSAECIAVASLVAYDIYRKYINPDCTGQQLLRVSRMMVVFYGLLSGFFGWFLYGVGANLGWVYNFMGIMIGSAVLPVSFCILTRYCTAKGAIIGAWGGMISSVITWLVIASTRCSDGRDPERLPEGETCPTGTLDINTTGNLYAQLGGNLVAICMSGIYCMLVTAIEFQFGNAKPFDWDIMRTGITRIEEGKDDVPDEEMSPEFLDAAGKWIQKMGVGLSLFLIIIWPLITVCWGVFSKSLYTIWASVAFVWGYVAAIVIIALPIYESFDTIMNVLTCNTSKKQAAAAETAKA